MSQEISSKEFIYFEKQINDSFLHYSSFDKYLVLYPLSDYLLGMKLYHMTGEVANDSIRNYYNHYLEAHQLFVKGTFTYFAEAMVLKETNNQDDYYKLLNTSFSLDTNFLNRYVIFELFLYNLQNNDDQYIKYLEILKKFHSDYTYFIIEHSNLLKTYGHIDQGIALLDSLIERNANPYACYIRSIDYYNSGDVTNANRILYVGLKIKEIPELYCGLGFLSEQMGNKQNALESFNKALQLDPNSKLANEKLGWYYIKNESNFTLALTYFKKMHECKPVGIHDDYHFLSYVYLSLNDLESARRTITEGKRLFGNDFQSDFFEIVLLVKEGNVKGAQDVFNEYVNSYDESAINWLKNELKAWNIVIEIK